MEDVCTRIDAKLFLQDTSATARYVEQNLWPMLTQLDPLGAGLDRVPEWRKYLTFVAVEQPIALRLLQDQHVSLIDLGAALRSRGEDDLWQAFFVDVFPYLVRFSREAARNNPEIASNVKVMALAQLLGALSACEGYRVRDNMTVGSKTVHLRLAPRDYQDFRETKFLSSLGYIVTAEQEVGTKGGGTSDSEEIRQHVRRAWLLRDFPTLLYFIYGMVENPR